MSELKAIEYKRFEDKKGMTLKEVGAMVNEQILYIIHDPKISYWTDMLSSSLGYMENKIS